ncbi:hypothetical protein [Chryseobacterium indologenes]|uniref:hypothetical protein n=1 Tax=Chryseobacterium indologenes TaxID=253 RepID=UPI003D3437C9
MTKEELLKIYSAYLPYGLEIGLSDEGIYNLDSEYPNEHAHKTGIITEFTISNGEFGYGEFKVSEKYYFSFNELSEVKPVIYPLEYLTKEIEHEGRSVCFLMEIDKKHPFNCTYQEMAEHIKTMNIDLMPFWLLKELLKYHFNVFNLLEDQYINKATLTNK